MCRGARAVMAGLGMPVADGDVMLKRGAVIENQQPSIQDNRDVVVMSASQWMLSRLRMVLSRAKLRQLRDRLPGWCGADRIFRMMRSSG